MARHSQRYSIIDRGTGYWYYKLLGWTSYRSTGIEIRYSRRGTPTNRAQAEQFAMEESDRAALQRRDGATVGAFLEPYYGPDCPRCARLAADGRPISENYRNSQRRRIKRHVLEDELATVLVREFRPGHIETWKQRKLAEGAGAKTINLALNAMSGAFSEAVHRGELEYNPVRSVSTIREDVEQRGIFTPAELTRMFFDEPECWGYHKGETGDGTRENRDYKPARLFHLLIATIGERPSAIKRLDWKHYDGETMTFPEVKDRRKNGRVVPLTSYAIEALDEWWEERVRVGPEDPIFGYDGGGRMGQTWYRKRFNRMMKVLSLPERDAWGGLRVPYSLKYTLETELIDRGANPALVRDLMGHSQQHGDRETVLTPVQARYRRRRAEKLRELVPVIEGVVYTK